MKTRKFFLALALVMLVGLMMPQETFARHHRFGPPPVDQGSPNDVKAPLDGGILALLFGAGAAFTAYKKRKSLKA